MPAGARLLAGSELRRRHDAHLARPLRRRRWTPALLNLRLGHRYARSTQPTPRAQVRPLYSTYASDTGAN